MKARAQRLRFPAFADPLGPVNDSTSGLELPVYGPWHPFTLAAGLLLPGVTHAVQPLEDGGRTLWLYAPDGTAWASATRPADATATRVRQVGSRTLWDELTAAHAWWQQSGQPDLGRFGITVTPGSSTAWLNSPVTPTRSARSAAPPS